MHSFGIVSGRIDDIFGDVTSRISKDLNNMIGIYYDKGVERNIILFRTFDGTPINYINVNIGLDGLIAHPMVSEVHVCSFNEEAWRVDTGMTNLFERFQSCLIRILITTDSDRDYQKLLLNASGLSDSVVYNGYYRINELILATSGVDPATYQQSLHKSMVSTRYLSDLKTIRNDHYSPLNADENRALHTKISIEARELFDRLSSSFTELMINNPQFRLFIKDKLSRDELSPGFSGIREPSSGPPSSSQSTQSSQFYLSNLPELIHLIETNSLDDNIKIRLARALSSTILSVRESVPGPPIVNLSVELEQLRTIISNMTDGFGSEKIPIVSIPELIMTYNSIADKVHASRIDPSTMESINGQTFRSVGGIFVTGAHAFYPDDVKISLKSGETLIIPTKCDDLSDFNDDELYQIQRYLNSTKSQDGRFNYILNKITETLARRVKR